jgi:HTH-type transcriptional regulator/antitoxin HigA
VAIFNATEVTPEADELALLMVLVQDYDNRALYVTNIKPLDAFIYKMNEKGIKAKVLEPIIGSKGHVSSILSGRREITIK